MHRLILTVVTIFLIAVSSVSAQEKKTRDQKVREDREKVTSEGFWLYNDLPRAFEVAKQTGKPM